MLVTLGDAVSVARGIAIAAAIGLGGCAPQLDGPIEHQRAIDRDDSARLAAQLAQLPGAVAADVVLHHAMRDPLATAAPSPAMLSAVITVDDQADVAALRGAAARLARAALPELTAAPAIEVNAAVHRPVVARVGPFTVEESSQALLRATLALGGLAIAGLAGVLAFTVRRHRLGNTAQ